MILIVGFGPAGQRVAEELLAYAAPRLVVLDANSANIQIAQRYGVKTQLGDATQIEVLEHAGVPRAAVIVITLPDPATGRLLLQIARGLAPLAKVFVRSRYHIHRWQFVHSGAHVVVDEEDHVGAMLADEVVTVLNLASPKTSRINGALKADD